MAMNKTLLSTLLAFIFCINTINAQVKNLTVKTAAALDDIEETRPPDSINSSSTSLQSGDITQLVDVRFPNVNIPSRRNSDKSLYPIFNTLNNIKTDCPILSLKQNIYKRLIENYLL